MSSRLPLGRVLAETVAIVASILLAFGIQAWWDARQESAQELSALRALLSELEENREIVERSIELHESFAGAAERLLHISLGLADAPQNRGDLVPLVGDGLMRYRTTNYVSGTLTALLSSGDLGLIENFELRRRVASWPAVLEEAVEDEQVVLDLRNLQWLPFMQERLPAFSLTGPNLTALPPDISTDRAASQISDLLGDDRFEAVLAGAVISHRTPVIQFQRLTVFLDELIRLLREEVAGREP